MADWNIVRFDPSYEEKIDPEILPLCDVLNASGFVTTASCCGHGRDWPRVWFEHSTDARIEKLARFVLMTERGDYRPYFCLFQKEILIEGYLWSLEIHLNDVYATTPVASAMQQAELAISMVTMTIQKWHKDIKS